MPRIFSATFRPFTYDELAKPLQQMTEAYQQQQVAFDSLMTDADKMRAFLNEDWQSYKDYKEYVDRLNYAAEDLSRNGLTRQNRGNLLQLKRDYDGKIQAINAGILSRQNEIENFRKSAKGQSSRYIGQRPEDYSVDEYMYGNMPFNPGVDGSEIYNYASEQTKSLTSRLFNDYTEGGKWIISEVGVDPKTTSMVMYALQKGYNFTDSHDYQRNKRQYDYMQSVLDGIRDIYDNTKKTYGYDMFSKFENGEEIPTSNSMKFNSELVSGINAGIQYSKKTSADPYGQAYYNSRLKEIEANNEFQRNLLLKGLENGSLLYNPSTGDIIQNPYYGKDSNGDLDNPVFPDVNVFGKTLRNTAVTESINDIWKGNNEIGVVENNDSTYSLAGVRDNEIKSLGFTLNINGQEIPVDNKIDLKLWIDAEDVGNLKEAYSVINKIATSTSNIRQTSNNGNYQELSQFINDAKNGDTETRAYYADMIDEYDQAMEVINTHVYRDRLVPDSMKITDKQYKKLKDAFGWKTEDPFTMNDMEALYIGNTNSRPRYQDLEYSLIGKTFVSSEGKRELTPFGSMVLSGLQNGIGVNEDKIVEYVDMGNDTYSKESKKSNLTDAKEYIKKDGILNNVYDVHVTKGMLLHKSPSGERIPLIKIKYKFDDGTQGEKILPMSRLQNNIEDEFRGIISELEETYDESTKDDVYTQKYIDSRIRQTIQKAFDKYEKK